MGKHTIAYGITYHFILISFGYALRGTRSGHKGYMAMGGSTTLSFGVCSLSACVRCWMLEEVGGVVMFGVAGVVNVMLGVSLFKARADPMAMLCYNGVAPTFMI